LRPALSVDAHVACQSRDLILHLQFAPLQLRQLKIVCRWMLEGISNLIFQHPVTLFEFNKLGGCGHVSGLLA
jgi:hypothetical protein